MTTTSTLDNQKCAIGAQVQAQGGSVNIREIHVNVNNRREEIIQDEFSMPRLIDTFHGREEELKKLDKLFFSKNKSKVVIHGLPGYGKSELSKQFAQQCLNKNKIKHIFWIKAENEGELNKLSTNLKKNYTKYQYVYCMYIFDNALNRRSICDYEPSNKKHKMLITSHKKDWGHGVVPIKLNPLTSKPVVKIFKTILEENYRKEDHDMYLELAQTVDNVPLGIQIIAGYVRQRVNCLGQSFNLTDCVEEMKQSKQKIINDIFSKDNPNPYKNSIYSALTVSLQKIKEEEDDIERRELALNILYVSAFLYPERIFIDNLLQIPTIEELISNNNNNSVIQLKSAISLLLNFSFVNYGDSDIFIKIHRLTQSFLIYYLSFCSLEDHCYRACFYSMFCIEDGAKSVLSYADVNTVHECIVFLKKVFQVPNTKEFIYEYDLFYHAAKWNRLEILEVLLHHADTETNDNAHKVLHSVARTWNTEAIELLIERGVHVNHKNAANKTPIDALLSTITSLDKYKYDKHHEEIMSTLLLLLQRGASINVGLLNGEFEFLLLSSAAERNMLELLELLLQQGMNVNSRGGTLNSTVLHVASASSYLKTIQVLVAHGANTNALDLDMETPSFKFIQHGLCNNRNIDKRKLREILDLLQCKEHSQISNSRGYSLLDLAVLEMHENLVTLLIQTYGCPVNRQNNFGNTPLHLLMFHITEESNKEKVIRIVNTLIECGACLNIKNMLQETPQQMLRWNSKQIGYKFKYLFPLLTSSDTETRRYRHRNCNLM